MCTLLKKFKIKEDKYLHLVGLFFIVYGHKTADELRTYDNSEKALV